MHKSIFYQSPFLYKFGLRLIHRENFEKRYRYFASFVKSGDLVLEPACGPAIVADFLPRGSFYYGFDLNENFVHYARNKNARVFIGDVLDFQNYFPADVVIACDVLHHLEEKEREKFIENCWQVTKKFFIVCEPYREDHQKEFWFEYIERDGTNSPKFAALWDRETLARKMENGFGKIENSFWREITQIGKDFIAVYAKRYNCNLGNRSNF
jgi:hypothetical protein